ncbi:MAG: amidohydrolase family protein, partial [Proteobacteria bacterium]|nr:amidohydrolase family protein [Pseudomonadota bacterium]
WVKKLFPEQKNYLDVYDHYGLITENSMFAHSIHLSDDEYAVLRDRGASVSLCPTSNLFLGSGLFDLKKMEGHNIPVSLGSDVGGGNSFSLFRVMSESYKVCQLRKYSVDPFRLFYLATLGAARSLHLEDKVGNLAPEKEADFIVVNPKKNHLMNKRLEGKESLLERLFAVIMLGDDRLIEATYSMGRRVYEAS